MNAAAELDALQPREDEERPFDPAQFAESHSEAILARVAAQLAKHEGRCHGALPDGSGKAKDFVPVRADRSEVDRASDHGRKCPILDLAVGQIQLGVTKIADANLRPLMVRLFASLTFLRKGSAVYLRRFRPSGKPLTRLQRFTKFGSLHRRGCV